jgi:hypothetical protein
MNDDIRKHRYSFFIKSIALFLCLIIISFALISLVSAQEKFRVREKTDTDEVVYLYGAVKNIFGKVFIVEHWDGENPEFYRINNKLAEEIKDYSGKFALIKGKDIKESKYSKEISAIEILYISNKPNPDWGRANVMKFNNFLVETGPENRLALIQNPKSKESVMYAVYGKKILLKKLNDSKGKYVDIKCLVVTDDINNDFFQKKVIIDEIYKIKDKPDEKLSGIDTIEDSEDIEKNLVGTKWEDADIKYIYGKVTKGKDSMSLIENWKSKSQVSYSVEVNYGKSLKNLDGKILMVEGKIIGKSGYSKEILVTDILLNTTKAEFDWDNVEEETFIGKVELGKDNKVVVVKDWTSRSRVSYYVYGEKESYLQSNVKNYAKIKCLVVQDETHSSVWTKHCIVADILKIDTKPFKK